MTDKTKVVHKLLIGFFIGGLAVVAAAWAITGERPGIGGLVALGLILLVVFGGRSGEDSGNHDAR